MVNTLATLSITLDGHVSGMDVTERGQTELRLSTCIARDGRVGLDAPGVPPCHPGGVCDREFAGNAWVNTYPWCYSTRIIRGIRRHEYSQLLVPEARPNSTRSKSS